MIKYCNFCDKNVETHTEDRYETYSVRGRPIKVDAEVRVCGVCGERICDIELDDKSLICAFNKYRSIKRLLMPDEIKAIREKYNVSQEVFSEILGMEKKSIKRYEHGSLQSEMENNLILLMESPENFKKLFERAASYVETEE